MLEYIACNIILFKLYRRSNIIPGIIFNIIPKIKKDYTRKCKSALNTTKQIIGGFSRSLITNMTSGTVPGAPGVQDGTYCRHLQEFSYKSKRNRSNLLTPGFSRSLIMNMTSKTVPGAPGARGG